MELMTHNYPDGVKHYVVEFKNTRRYWESADFMSEWCREVWGDTDHRTNARFKWRRRMMTFVFTNEHYRTMFLLKFSEIDDDNDH